MIKNIIFDLSEVIIRGQYGIEKIIAEHTGIDELIIDEDLMNIGFEDLLKGKITEDEYSKNVIKKTGWDITVDFLKQITRENFNMEIEGTQSLIERLKKKGMNLYLLSDNAKEWIEYILDNTEKLHLFDKKFFSCDIGYLKKEKEAFEIVIEDLNINVDETLFIDDSKKNIMVASELGIKCILFENSKQLEEELLKLQLID